LPGWLCRPASWLCQFDARRLPFRPGVFDAVVLTNMLLQYVWPRSARVETAREVRRVLAPGGFACFHISIWPLAEDLLGCRAPKPVRRGLRFLIGLAVLAVNLLTDLLRAVFRTRLQPGDRWTGRGVLAFFHMHSRAELAREIEEAGLVARDWFLDDPSGPIRERWNGQSALLVATPARGDAGKGSPPDGKA
jgi:SAM-dependent methyltransferase